jgi:error-prone DNA polymerase
MPAQEFIKLHTHPFKAPPSSSGTPASNAAGQTPSLPDAPQYVELSVTTNFTFLTGASHPEEFVQQAVALGHSFAAISDVNSLAGVVRAHVSAKDAGIALLVGCRVRLREVVHTPGATLDVLVYPTTLDAYARLCRLLTLGKRRAPKGECHLTLDDLLAHQHEQLAIVVASSLLSARRVRNDDDACGLLRALRSTFDDDRLSLGVSRRYGPDDRAWIARCAALAQRAAVPLVATNDAHAHVAQRRALQDVLTCVRLGCSVQRAGRRLWPNAERHLKSPVEMAALFDEHPQGVARSVQIARRASGFDLGQLRYRYPADECPQGTTPIAYLRQRVEEGCVQRYPEGVPTKVRAQIEHELALIDELGYEAYFLTCDEIVRFARGRGILCQGRGGAANSAVCFVLGITEVDPARFNLLFERFVSRARREPPDIDIDFEHERREEVIQHIYQRYGRDRAALTAEVISYRARSAVRDVGKALGLSQDCVDTLARQLDRWGEAPSAQRVRDAGLDPSDPTIALVLELTAQLIGFPRHLSQHVGGFVITSGPLCELVPIENAAMEDRSVIEWDKDDIDAMGMLKVDILGLGMLTCVRRALEMIEPLRTTDTGGASSTFRRIVALEQDARVYDMISRGDTLGVFQIESRAQMSMLPRLKPACFYDLVIEVAIVRPGPIQGGMVHPYLRRRQGLEPVTFPSPEVEAVLARTLGVPLFQEQAMQLAIVAAGFTPDEADALRRAMAAWKRKGNLIFTFGRKLIDGMVARGYPLEFAERCFDQIKGFSEYGFPESHAASFALIVYVSSWLKRHHPAALAAALINSQPMGFYAPAQIVRDAEEHGVGVRPVDVNVSRWDCTLEATPSPDGTGAHRASSADATARAARWSTLGHDGPGSWGRHGSALRLGMRLVRGLSQHDAERIVEAIGAHGAASSVRQLWRVSGVKVSALRALARADAFASMGLDRQSALWQIRALRDERLPLFEQEPEAAPEESGDEGGGGGGGGWGGGADDGCAHAELDHDAKPAEDAAIELDADPSPWLPSIDPRRAMLGDYQSVGLSLRAHPVTFLRTGLRRRGVIEAGELRDERLCPSKREVGVAGVVLVRQRPGTASGVVFVTLEDETGIVNLIVWPKVFERYRQVGRLSAMLLAWGRVERQGEVVHVHAQRLQSLDALAPSIGSHSRDFH